MNLLLAAIEIDVATDSQLVVATKTVCRRSRIPWETRSGEQSPLCPHWGMRHGRTPTKTGVLFGTYWLSVRHKPSRCGDIVTRNCRNNTGPDGTHKGGDTPGLTSSRA